MSRRPAVPTSTLKQTNTATLTLCFALEPAFRAPRQGEMSDIDQPTLYPRTTITQPGRAAHEPSETVVSPRPAYPDATGTGQRPQKSASPRAPDSRRELPTTTASTQNHHTLNCRSPRHQPSLDQRRLQFATKTARTEVESNRRTTPTFNRDEAAMPPTKIPSTTAILPATPPVQPCTASAKRRTRLNDEHPSHRTSQKGSIVRLEPPTPKIQPPQKPQENGSDRTEPPSRPARCSL